MKLDTIALIGAATFATAMVFTALTAEAQANGNCAPRATAAANLAERYQETPSGRGLASDGSAVEVFSNPETGSWSILVTMPNGISCMVASGQSWSALVQDPAPQGEPL